MPSSSRRHVEPPGRRIAGYVRWDSQKHVARYIPADTSGTPSTMDAAELERVVGPVNAAKLMGAAMADRWQTWARKK